MGVRFSTPVQTGLGAHPASCTMSTGSFLGLKSGRGVTLTPHPPSSAMVKKKYSYTSTPPMGCTACTEPQCQYNGALYLYLYLYSPYELYGLYRASVPVQGCTLPLPIPLLPLYAIQPVQSLSACTRVHFTFTYTSTPPMGCMACTEPQCLYNGALYLYLYLCSPYVLYSKYRASVSVLTVHCTFTYTSTPPMCRTACTEPQCLY